MREGQIVKKGQILAYLSDVQFSSDVRANHRKVLELHIKIARLKAQISDKKFIPTAEMKQKSPHLVAAQQALFKAKNNEMSLMRKRLRLLQRELNMTRPAVRRGAASEVEVLRIEQSIHQIRGEMSAKRSESIKELEISIAELAKVQEEAHGLKDRLQRTSVRSPVKGVIKQIHVTTEGGVIKAGMAMMEIVPLEDTLLVEARIQPDKIGFIHVGQSATVKVTAYDYSIYGGIKGKN